VYRSILEAIALTMKDKVDAMCEELGTSLGEVVISGGGATSPLFMHIFADTFGIPASAQSGRVARASVPAICRRGRNRRVPDFQSAVAGMERPPAVVRPPNAANAEAYRRMNAAVYRGIREATDPVLERSFPLFH